MNAVDFMAKKIADGWIRGVKGNEYAEDLTSGDATAVIGWSGDMFILKSENEGKFDFAIPESGGTISGDNLMIPSTVSAEGKVNAEKLINFYYEPAIAAEVAAYVNYVCPVKGAQAEMEKIAPELASSPFIFPDGPSNAKNEPSGIVNDKSLTAVKSPYDFVMRVRRKSPRVADETSATSCRRPSGTPRSKKFLLQELMNGRH